MNVSILLHGSDYRGDHAADVVIAHELARPDETVVELIDRLLDKGNVINHIELRRIAAIAAPRKETP